MTKIKIIGDPGQQPVKQIQSWLKKCLKKFSLSSTEVDVAFIENALELERLFRICMQDFEYLPLETRIAITELEFEVTRTTAYINEFVRKNKVPPTIFIRKDGKISENDILDEVAHMREDADGWSRIKWTALGALWVEYERMQRENLASFFVQLRRHISDVFSSEMMCQYGLTDEMMRDRRERLNFWLKNHYLKKGKSKIEDFIITMKVAFYVTLPPSYPQKEDEEKLEKIIIDLIRQMGMELLYREIKSIISKLESPPNVANIYKCGAEIIELTQEFLEK